MSNLQITLGIVGVLFIAAVIGHGMWTMRKNSVQSRRQAEQVAEKRQRADSQDTNSGFDDDGIGSVRVVKRDEPVAVDAEQMSMNLDEEDNAPLPSMRVDEPKTTTKPSAKAAQTELNLEPDAESEKTAPEDTIPNRSDSDLGTDEESTPAQQLESEEPVETESPAAIKARRMEQAPQEVISLFVKGSVQGSVLLQMMTELGCKFGDMGIFHRYEQTSGNGPLIFSVANMFNPGTFDLDNIENFETEGVALFMTLPIDYDGQQAFNMMLNAAKKLAMEIPQGQVLDGQMQVLSRPSIQKVHQTIREYEKTYGPFSSDLTE